MAYAPWNYDDSPSPEEQPAAQPEQFVSKLETWPPQGGMAMTQPQYASQPAGAQSSPRITAWIFLLFGLILWPSALITGIWALNRVREGEKDCTVIAVLGLGFAALNIIFILLVLS